MLARTVALAGASGLLGCPDTQIDSVSRDGDRGDPRSAAVRAGESDERELAHRLGAPDTRRLPVGRPPTGDDPALEAADPAGDPGEPAPSVVEGIAWGDLPRFEARLREELAAFDLELTAAVDLQGEPASRLFVVTPAADRSDLPQRASQRAEATLERARLVVAYAREDEPDRVHIAYLSPEGRGGVAPRPRQYDAEVDAAIHRAAER